MPLLPKTCPSRRLPLVLPTLVATFGLALAGVSPALAVTVTVQSVGTTGDTPTASDNDYRRLADALGTLVSGDVLELEGTFDWTEPFAAASWAAGNDGIAATADDYSLTVPPGLAEITLTPVELTTARIQGPGDLPGEHLDGFLHFRGGPNPAWRISDLEIFDFSTGIVMHLGSSPDAYDDTRIEGNHIRVATDLAADSVWSIAIQLGFGTDQRVSGNLIQVPGDGVSDYSASFTAGTAGLFLYGRSTTAWDGLEVRANTFQVLGKTPPGADGELVALFFDEASAHASDIRVVANTIEVLDHHPLAPTNYIIGFSIRSRSSATGDTTVSYIANQVSGTMDAFRSMPIASGALPLGPVLLDGNDLTNNAVALRVNQDPISITCNRLVGNDVAIMNTSAQELFVEGNWWGCNGGPNTPGCDTTLGIVTSGPWAVLGLSALPSPMEVGQSAVVTADLLSDSAGAALLCAVADGIPIAYSATGGSVSPTAGLILEGSAETTWTAATVGLTAGVTATVDSQSVTSTTQVTAPTLIFQDGFESGDTTAWSATVQ